MASWTNLPVVRPTIAPIVATVTKMFCRCSLSVEPFIKVTGIAAVIFSYCSFLERDAAPEFFQNAAEGTANVDRVCTV